MKAFVMYKEAVKASDYKIRNCSSGITVRYGSVKENLVRDTFQLRHGSPDNTDSFVGFRRTEQGNIVFRHEYGSKSAEVHGNFMADLSGLFGGIPGSAAAGKYKVHAPASEKAAFF